MGVLKRWRGVVPGLVGAMLAAVVPVAADPRAATPTMVTLEASPGSLVRWSVPGTKTCSIGKRSWTALQETCYYPIDFLRGPLTLTVSRSGVGPTAYAQISVLSSPRVREDIALGAIPQANPSPADLKRNLRDQALVGKLWTKHDGPARFTLPLGPPASGLPEGKDFGAEWVFDGNPESTEMHSGADYALAPGTPIAAVADGTVVVAEDLFFAGNAVFIDHGDGLVSMSFHLSELKVHAGQVVKKGEVLGLVGSTGRVTGPHFHLGVRWHDARIDPRLLLEDPNRIPSIGP